MWKGTNDRQTIPGNTPHANKMIVLGKAAGVAF
jgi:hypothetical protein